MTDISNPAIEAQMRALASMNIADLRARWRATFKSEPPKAFGPDLLRRSLAQKLQEGALADCRHRPKSS